MKPQDVLVLLKLAAHPERNWTVRALAEELFISTGEISAAHHRLKAASLLRAGQKRLNVSGLEEFLVHALKYLVPPVRGGMTGGLPTSYAAAPLNRLIVQGQEPPPVWPFARGTARGVALAPIYKSAPEAASKDPALYELLALADAFREGKARERSIGLEELRKRLR